ncbi:TPA: hypothetical protein RI735_001416 [Vibrio cholerae]|nr:hypothetical protein [Vibrio cholerae]HDV5385478.1 hypothetical protein [Vibrio cholerae]
MKNNVKAFMIITGMLLQGCGNDNPSDGVTTPGTVPSIPEKPPQIEVSNAINDFISSNGKKDFDIKLISGFSNEFDIENSFFYKFHLLKNEKRTLENKIQEAISLGNISKSKLDRVENALYTFEVAGVNKDGGFNASFVKETIDLLSKTSEAIKKSEYEKFSNLIIELNEFSYTDGYIDYNKIGSYLLDYAPTYDSIYRNRSNYTYINTRNSASILRFWDGIAVGKINSDLAPNSNSNILILRDALQLPWEVNANPTLSKILTNSIKLNSKNLQYNISTFQKLSEKQKKYPIENNLNFIFEETNTISEKYNAYFSNGLTETTNQCKEIEEKIKKGLDLYIYHKSQSPGDNSLENNCLSLLTERYYGIKMTTQQNPNERRYQLNHGAIPSTVTFNNSTTMIGSQYEHQQSKDNTAHFIWTEIVGKITPFINDSKDTLIIYNKEMTESLHNKNIDQYFDSLSKIIHAIRQEMVTLEESQTEFELKNDYLLINNDMLPIDFFEYSINFGSTFKSMSRDGVYIRNQNFQKNQIQIRINQDVLDFINPKFNKVWKYEHAIDYLPTIPTDRFDAAYPNYVSEDGNHKIYGYHTDGQGNGLDIVIIGDGYLDKDRALFNMHAQSAMNSFLSYENLAEHIGAYTIHTIFTASKQRGADWSIEEGCSDVLYDNCKHLSYAINNSLTNKNDRDTFYDAGFFNRGKSNTARLLGIDGNKAVSVVNSYVPYYDQIIAIVNTNIYGGAGGTIATASKFYDGVFIHELGHSHAGLADEYHYTQTNTNPNYCKKNVCAVWEKREWKHFQDVNSSMDNVCKELSAECPNGSIGWYEGGDLGKEGIWRPTYDSIMRSIHQPFHAFNAEVWADALFSKVGFFQPILPEKSIVKNPEQTDTLFSIYPLVEYSNVNNKIKRVMDFKWHINNKYDASFDNKLSIKYGRNETGKFTVKVVAEDKSGVIIHKDKKQKEYEWNIENNAKDSIAKWEFKSHEENHEHIKMNISIKERKLSIESKELFTVRLPIHNIDPEIYNGLVLNVFNGENSYNFIPVNATYSHDSENGEMKAPFIPYDDAIFNINLSPDFFNKDLVFSLWEKGERVEAISELNIKL